MPLKLSSVRSSTGSVNGQWDLPSAGQLLCRSLLGAQVRTSHTLSRRRCGPFSRPGSRSAQGRDALGIGSPGLDDAPGGLGPQRVIVLALLNGGGPFGDVCQLDASVLQAVRQGRDCRGSHEGGINSTGLTLGLIGQRFVVAGTAERVRFPGQDRGVQVSAPAIRAVDIGAVVACSGLVPHDLQSGNAPSGAGGPC